MIDKKVLIVGAIVGGLALLAGVMIAGGNRQTADQAQTTGPVIADFKLLDQDGKQVSRRDILGRPSLFFFGFTFCPDVCPTMLASMSASLVKLGDKSGKLGVYFVSVDPERDTPSVLKSYLSSFDPRIRGLTGTPAQIDAVAKSLGIYHAKVDTGGGNYSIDHSALLIQLDSQGRFFGTIAFDEAPDAVQAKLQRLVEEGMR